ncbi:hypothetical protein [Paracoccus aerodenitrificans]|uniref:hypothetical protein n=1 Tax=Paracoccus aerodenitrificans TaxID=3017781 RepID=UPI0022F0C224|nr:hypothetical protein [Paracoccus aerodenitrificans]WBU65311.1 hypothetical protein PAE61_07820 [Paracoccus aerodenitrificans]
MSVAQKTHLLLNASSPETFRLPSRYGGVIRDNDRRLVPEPPPRLPPDHTSPLFQYCMSQPRVMRMVQDNIGLKCRSKQAQLSATE